MKKQIALVPTLTLLLFACGNENSRPNGSGLIEAREVTISAETEGQLLRMYFDEGDQVNTGDTLAMIDTSIVMLTLRQAQLAVEAAEIKIKTAVIRHKQAEYNRSLAEKEFKRIGSLIGTGSANQKQYEQADVAYSQALLEEKAAQAVLEAAQAEKEQALAQAALCQKRLDNSFPVAPLDGVIVTRFVEPGELVAAGRPLVKIASLDTVWVKIYLPPADLPRIRLAGRAVVDPEDGTGRTLEGKVSWISDQAEFTPKNVQTKKARADLVYAVKVTIPNPDHRLKIGMPVFVVLP